MKYDCKGQQRNDEKEDFSSTSAFYLVIAADSKIQ